MSKTKTLTIIIYFSLIWLVTTTCSLLLLKTELKSKTITSDALGYYAYLPSFIIYKDINLAFIAKSLQQERYAYLKESNPPTWAGFKCEVKNEISFCRNKYSIGVALLMSPFFIIIHTQNSYFLWSSPNGFSSSYQLIPLISASFYLAIGVLAIVLLLLRHFSLKVSLISSSLIVFGTHLFHYATYDAGFSHVYSFSVASLYLLILNNSLYLENKSRHYAFFAGLLAGIILLIRPANIFLVLIPLLLLPANSISNLSLKALCLLTKKHLDMLVIFMLSAGCILLLQASVWYFSHNSFLVYSYSGESFQLPTLRNIFNVLFSVQKGILVQFPILFLAVISSLITLLISRTKNKGRKIWSIILLSYLSLQTIFIASWHMWWLGAGFGHRAFVDSLALFAFPLASVIQFIASCTSTKRILLSLLLIFLTIWNLWFTSMYWRRIIPQDTVNAKRAFNLERLSELTLRSFKFLQSGI